MSREIITIISQTNYDSPDTIEIECQDHKGNKIQIEYENTADNIKVINLVTDFLTVHQ